MVFPLSIARTACPPLFKNLTKDAKEDATRRYDELYRHYGVVPTRNNRGKGHENGGVESPHGHLKNRIRQALLIRNSVDFESVTAYQQWIDAIVRDINIRNRDKVAQERKHLKTLAAPKDSGLHRGSRRGQHHQYDPGQACELHGALPPDR